MGMSVASNETEKLSSQTEMQSGSFVPSRLTLFICHRMASFAVYYMSLSATAVLIFLLLFWYYGGVCLLCALLIALLGERFLLTLSDYCNYWWCLLILEGLRSAATTNYVTPRLRTRFGEHAFSHAGPAAWNRLPETVRQAQTQPHFKRLLKTFLFNEFL